VPLLVDWDPTCTYPEFAAGIASQLQEIGQRTSFALDLIGRVPGLAGLPLPWRSGSHPVVIERVRQLADGHDLGAASADLTVTIPDDGASCVWTWRGGALGARVPEL
jgi:hypothetical protein